MARLKTINKFIKLRIGKESFYKKEPGFWQSYKKVKFYINGELQTKNYFDSNYFNLFFKEILNMDFEILLSKILLFKKTLSTKISKYHFDNPFEGLTYNNNLEIHYLNENNINLSKPDKIVFNYGSYSLTINISKNNLYSYKETVINIANTKHSFIFDKNFNSNKLLFLFLKHKLETQENIKINEPIIEENVNNYVSLLKMIEYK